MEKLDLKRLAEQVAGLAERTGRLLERDASDVRQKEGHGNYVTDMDLRVQQTLIGALAALLPGSAFLAEEEGAQQSSDGYLWVIDPIDGTQNFIKNCRQSAISIGLLFQGRGLLGVTRNPYLQETFVGIAGEGAWLNGRPIHVSETPLEEAVLAFGSSPYRRDLIDRTFELGRRAFAASADFRRSGAAVLDLCYVAAGRYDGYFELNVYPWDYTASVIILQAAGGCAGVLGSDDWDFTRQISLVAGNPRVYGELKSLLEQK